MRLHPLHTVDWIIQHIRCTGEYFPQERRTGRSEQLALEFIVKAMRNPYQWHVVTDHHGTTNASRNLCQRIRAIVIKLGYEQFHFKEEHICFGEPPRRLF